VNYLEFKQAAKKHYYTSLCLYEKCNNSWQIQENIFYLCGYVIEMMLKYQIFASINYDRDKDVTKIDDYGITSDDITSGRKGHNIYLLSQILKKFRGDSIIDDIIKKFRKWDISLRYNGKRNNYTNNDIEELLKLSEKLIEKFGG